MTTSKEQIVALRDQRKAAQSPVIGAMSQIRDAYQGEIVVPLPELETSEKSAVANLISTGIDKTGMKIASVTPNLWYPALDPGKRQSEKKAATRRRANLAWWEQNKLNLKMRRRARHFVGYGCTPVILRPDPDWQCARWEVRDPLSAFPAPSADPDEITPRDIIFTFQRTYGWLKEHYPEQLGMLHQGRNPLPSDRYDLIEYADAEETVLVCVGQPRLANEDFRTAAPGQDVVELKRTPNRTGMCLAVMPGRVTLDRMMGQFDQLLGPLEMQSRLTALEYIAVKKSVFPDLYLVSRPNEQARFVAGPFDGSTGQVNVVTGGEMVPMNLQPGYRTEGMVDRLERAQRVTAGIPAEFGGESSTNVRTGKRGDAIMAEVIDTVVQEAQEVLALSLQEENRRAVAIAKTYWGSTAKTFYLGSAGAARKVDYIPNVDFENDHSIVTYPLAGTDVNGLIVGAGQRIGLGTMSKKTFMEIDPQIADPEREIERIRGEALEAAALSSLQQQAASGQLPLPDLARIIDLVQTGTDFIAAVVKAQAEAQQRQTTPVPAGDPATAPGLAAPGMGAEAPPDASTVNPPSQNVSNLAQVLSTLQRSGRPTRPTPVAG